MAQSWNKLPKLLRKKIDSARNSKKIEYSKDTLSQLEDLHIMVKKVRKSLKADEKASRLGKSPNKATWFTDVRFGSTATKVFSSVGGNCKKCSYGRTVIQMDKWVYRDTSKNKEEKDINMYLGASAVSPPPSPRSPIKLFELETDIYEWDYNLETDIYEFEERAETEINEFDNLETVHVPRQDPSASDSDGP